MNHLQVRFAQSTGKVSRCALAVAMLSAGAASADDGGPSIRFSGFGTLGVAHSSEKNADFTSVGDQPNGAGHARSWDFNPDSKLAGQADIKFGEQLAASAQLMARQRYDNSFTPELMMAFGKWQATPELALRAGRLPLPVFLISDSRNVSYSQTQLRPPVDAYRYFSAYHFDGADLTWATTAGSVAMKTQLFAGTSKTKLPSDTDLKLAHIAGANLAAEAGDMTVRLSYLGTKVSLSNPGLSGAFQGVRYGFPAGTIGPGSPAIPGAAALADQYEIADKSASYTSLGFNYDPGRWFVTSEVGVVTEFALSPKQTLGYLSGGIRYGAFTPYATVSKIKTQIAGSTTGHPVVDAMRTSSAALGQKTLSLGLRWDAMKNSAIKTQFDHVRPDSGSNGQLINTQAGFQPGIAYNVISASVDFVF